MQSAAKGFPNAYNALGVMAYNGILVPQDYEFAHSMFEVGATSGEMDSLFNLGAQYLAGNGVDKDLQKGFEYIKKANRAGQWQAPLQVKVCPGISSPPYFSFCMRSHHRMASQICMLSCWYGSLL